MSIVDEFNYLTIITFLGFFSILGRNQNEFKDPLHPFNFYTEN